MQGYGMTETSPRVHCARPARRRAQGWARPASRCCTPKCASSTTTARTCRRGEIGELWVRGPEHHARLLEPAGRQQASFTDGWLHTGDAARIDEEGFYYIVDRRKDMYISGGENVYPAEVENVLYQLPQMAEAAVIGVPNEHWGEVGMAIVALKPGHSCHRGGDPRALRGQPRALQAPALIEFVEALPRNATGKMHKPTLRKNFGAERGAGKAGVVGARMTGDASASSPLPPAAKSARRRGRGWGVFQRTRAQRNSEN